METTKAYIAKIRNLIAKDDLPAALQLFQKFQQESPFLKEVIHQSGRFQHIRKQIRLGMVSFENAHITRNQVSFGLLDLLNEIEQKGKTPLPADLKEEIITEGSPWWTNLHQVLKSKASVSDNALSVSQQYGWLIEEFLRKMMTKPKGADKHPPLRSLSFMAEAFQSSLRYLCFIQIAQLLKLEDIPQHPFITEFLNTKQDEYVSFDYLNLLLIATELLQSKTDHPFVPNIGDLVEEISDTESELYETVIFLQNYRNQLLKNTIPENGQLNQLLEEYLTGLVYWLRHIAFFGGVPPRFHQRHQSEIPPRNSQVLCPSIRRTAWDLYFGAGLRLPRVQH